jgi:hypothetical protein
MAWSCLYKLQLVSSVLGLVVENETIHVWNFELQLSLVLEHFVVIASLFYLLSAGFKCFTLVMGCWCAHDFHEGDMHYLKV